MTRRSPAAQAARLAELQRRAEDATGERVRAPVQPEAPFHLACLRKLTPLPAGGSICLHCRVAFEDVEHDGVKARVVVDEGGR